MTSVPTTPVSVGITKGSGMTGPSMSGRDILKALNDHLDAHKDHAWEQTRRCVYCADCGVQLYQGTIPPSHTNVRRRRRYQEPTATQEMRDRWGKR